MQNVLTGCLLVCALVVVGFIIVDRQVEGVLPLPEQTAILSIEQRQLLAAAAGAPPQAARVTVFSDYACPACQELDRDLTELAAAQPSAFQLQYKHLFLPDPRLYSVGAALAVECAADQNRRSEYHQALFDAQARFGVESWIDIARAVHMPEIDLFTDCVVDRTPWDRIDEDIELGRSLGIAATPAIVIDSLLVIGHPGRAELERLLYER